MRLDELWRRVRFFVRGSAATRELEDEMRLHLALRAERYEESGMSSVDASRAARRRFGSAPRVVEASRDAWLTHWIDALIHDVRYAVRGLRRAPMFAAVAVTTLSLGLGLNAAIYSLLDRLFVRPPAGVADPASLRRFYLTQTLGGKTYTRDVFNYPEQVDLRGAAHAGSVATSAYAHDTAAYSAADGAADARFIAVDYTDAAYWPLLGVHPTIGRTFTDDESRIENAGDVAIVSDAFWQRELGGARGVLGRTIRVGIGRYTIIGVAPRAFTGADLGAVDIWLPLGAMPIDDNGQGSLWYQLRGVPRLHILARAKPSGSAGLDARLTAALRAGMEAAGTRRPKPPFVSTGPIVEGLGPMTASQETVVATRLAWVSLLVLVVACASVANLMLARLVERRREIAVRLSLGASRGRLATQLVVESLLLGGLALLGALVLGAWTGAALQRTLMPDTHWAGGMSVIGWRLAAAIAAAALAGALAVGLTPMLQLRHVAGADALKTGARTTPHAARLRRALVILQTALAVVLVSGAALFIQSLRRVQHVDLGYDVDRILFAEPALVSDRGGKDASRNTLLTAGLSDAARRLASTPGIGGVALASHGPMAGYFATDVRIPGRDSTPTLGGSGSGMQEVSSEYWSVVGLRAVEGRLTTDADVAGAPLVIVLNESMARAIWPGKSALGECVKIYGSGSPCRTVVGVVRDVHLLSIVEPPRMQFYVPLAQGSVTGGASRPMAIILRAAPSSASAAEIALSRVLTELLPPANLNLYEMHALLEPQLRPWRLGATLFSVLSALALTIAAVGLYGVVAYGVRSRTRELGIRLALGAPRERVARAVVRDGVGTVAIGVACGTILAAVGVRFVGSLLYDTSLRDPAVLIAVAVALLATAVVASAVPAWRAASVDPAIALRSE